MDVWAAAAWGLTGGLVVEAQALYSMIRGEPSLSWRAPIPQGLASYLISVGLRVGVGAGLAAAAAGSGQVSGAFAAFGLGIAAPLVVEKLATGVPLTGVSTVPVQIVSQAETEVLNNNNSQTAERRERRRTAKDAESDVVDDAS
jgi:hypothetical protein